MLFTRLVKIHQPIFLRSAQPIIEKLNYKRWILCSWQRGQTNPFRHFALRNASPPFCRLAGEGASGTNPLSRLRRQLSRRESPWQRGQVSSSPVNGRRSQPISGKRSAFAKASPFRERWHGEAVTERVDPSSGPAERPACSVKLRSCKKQEHSTSRLRQNLNGRSIAGVSPCQRETILLKRKKNALFYKMEKATYHSSQNEQKNLVHVHKKTTLV